MTTIQLIVLALVQGIAEFLPISSSAHLILLPKFLDWVDQGVMIDGALHIGTLAAVVLYFRHETLQLLQGVGHLLTGRWRTWPARLVLMLVIATIPAVIFGFALAHYDLADDLRSIELIGWTTIIFALVLHFADRYGAQVLRLTDWTLNGALLIGLAQAIALIPGVSRSGITMASARMMGFERTEAARISLLMSIPVTFATGSLIAKEIIESGDATLGHDAIIAAGLAFVAAYLTLALLMSMLRRFTLLPFVLYRLGLGAVLLWVAYA